MKIPGMQKILTLFILLGCQGFVGLNACETGEVELRIVVAADNFPTEILWTLYDSTGDPLFDGGPGEFTFCVPNNECRRWVITDSANDGICCAQGFGYYQIFVDGIEVQTGGDYGASAEHQINCPPGVVCESALNVSEGLHGTIAKDSYYAFTPNQTGEYKITSCLGIPCASKVFVYEECLGSFDLSQVGSMAFNEGACSNGNAFVQVLMQAGQKYYIRLHNDLCEQSFTWQLTYEGAVTGCMDSSACNFDPFATIPSDCLFFPNPDCPGGLPDLELDQAELLSSLHTDVISVDDQCMINEGCAAGYGLRNILRFTTMIHNIGESDFVIGQVPSGGEASNQFEWDQCHNHWHYEGYASYQLFDSENKELSLGFKNGFCVTDLVCPTQDMYKYDCYTMGISPGCTDFYPSDLPCQWLDITGLEAGDYTLVVKVNWDEQPDLNGRLESDYSNNYAKVCFTFVTEAGSSPYFIINEDCPAPTDCAGVEYGNAIIDCEGECGGTTITGDINNDGERNFEDVDAAVQNILAEDADALSTCTDLNGDGALNIVDAYYLYACYKQTLEGGTDDPNDDHCGFPYGTQNPNVNTVLSLMNIDYEQSYIDVGIINTLNEVVAFEFEMSGIDITNVSKIIDQEDLVIALNYNSESGKIMGYVISDEPIFKHVETTPLLRIHFNEITESQICLPSIEAILNEALEEVNVSIDDACILASGIDDLPQGSLSDISISPNPFYNKTSITFPNSKGETFTISVYDVNGGLVLRTSSIEEELIVEGIAGGQIYTFFLESRDIYYTGKLICLK